LDTEDNSGASNKSFTAKKDYVLSNGSHYSMNNYFSNVSKWNEEEIIKRIDDMYKKIKEIFPSPFTTK
jgi:hypothetical protein